MEERRKSQRFDSFNPVYVFNNENRESLGYLENISFDGIKLMSEDAIVFGSAEESFRKASGLINRICYQRGVTPSRTLQKNTKEEGMKILEHIG